MIKKGRMGSHVIWGFLVLLLVVIALLKWVYGYAVRRERAASILVADRLAVERSLIDEAPAAIVVLDRNGNVRRWNLAAERMFGWAEHEVLGLESPFLTEGGADRTAWEQALRGETADVEIARRGKDGRIVETLLSAAPLLNERGEVTGVMEWMTDRSERHQLQSQLRQAQALSVIGRLAGGIVHDFNNLLAVVDGHTELILEDLSESSPVRQHALEVQKACGRAQSLSGQLLALRKGKAIPRATAGLNAIVREVAGMLRRIIGKGIEWELALAPDAGLFQVDSGSVHEVLMNLVLNARDAMPNGGKITIETALVDLDEEAVSHCQGVKVGRYALLAVNDTGVGFDPEASDRLFQPLFTTKQEGSGLGLAIVQRIVAESQGCIRTGSQPGKGARFEIYLPQIGPASAN
jgi:two-component system cell cycle sensor histidine kinase/response regulator CckA